MVNPTEIQSYLKYSNYPATKEELLNVARNSDAPQGILDLLRELPDDQQFMSPAEVMQEIPEFQSA